LLSPEELKSDIEVNAVQTTDKGKINRYVLSGDLLAGRVTVTVKADNSKVTAKSWYHLDHLNSTKVVTSATATVEVRYVYRAFGEQLKRLDAAGAQTDDKAKYSYGGKELDDETNLYYFNARYYDATTGRFINVDPVQDGSNWYVYCRNNPLSMKDPTGLFFIFGSFFELVLPRYLGPSVGITKIYPLPTDLYPPMIIAPNTSIDEIDKPYYTQEGTDNSGINWQNPPSGPSNLGPDWENKTDPRDKTGLHEKYKNKKTGEEIEWHKDKDGDHWHRNNPNRQDTKTQKDYYLDDKGNPCAKQSPESHIFPKSIGDKIGDFFQGVLNFFTGGTKHKDEKHYNVPSEQA
jgi:RHS repeat-associated protein